MRGSCSKKGGFTLIELLVVIGIILILASILTPALLSAKRKADVAKCLTNVKSLGTAMMIYANDHENNFPFAATSDEAFGYMYHQRDFSETQVYLCPSNASRSIFPAAPAANGGALVANAASSKISTIDYFIVAASPDTSVGTANVNRPSLSDPTGNVLLIEDFSKGLNPNIYDDGDNHNDTGNISFINGSAKAMSMTNIRDHWGANADSDVMPQNLSYNTNAYYPVGTACVFTTGFGDPTANTAAVLP